MVCRLLDDSVPPSSRYLSPPYFVEGGDSRVNVEDPETFKPERWADDLEKQLPRGVYIPFGDGPRVCIGKGFALMEAILLLATIAQKFRLNLVPEFPIVPQPSITLRPEYGIKVVVERR
ncbi:cytochrome P450 [Gloeocapsa sp. BRSZ]